jgi:hypothetical protein
LPHPPHRTVGVDLDLLKSQVRVVVERAIHELHQLRAVVGFESSNDTLIEWLSFTPVVLPAILGSLQMEEGVNAEPPFICS